MSERRTVVRLALIAVSLAMLTAAPALASTRGSGARVETRSLDALYAAARAEGGRVVLYAGGDQPGQFDQTKRAFEARFPGVTLDVQVDLSRYHGARIDNQLVRRRLEPDVAMLQTTHDFDRWKSQGVLRPYKPIGWEQVDRRYRDPSGAYVGTSLVAFTNVINTDLVPAAEQALDYGDYLLPRFKDQIALTYPNDDDAVLFQWKLIVDEYGWGYVDALMAQNPLLLRGTPASVGPLVGGQKQANFAALIPFSGIPGLPVKIVPPASDPFVSWAQRSAIFKQARHPAGAELLQSWLLTKDVQRALPAWSVRRDVAPPNGFKAIGTYNTDPDAFVAFMSDRAAVDRFRDQLALYVGDPIGPNPAGVTGRGPFFTP